jgi:type II secretory pathway pseudopilin PulG
MTTIRSNANRRAPRHAATGGARAGERGFALVALLAVMFVLALAITAAAPAMRQQSMRELEKESIARGEEVVEAIAQFTRAMGRLPTSMDELVKGYTPPQGGFKTIYPLRKSAARDPLSSKGEWKLIHQTDRVFTDFSLEVIKYNGGTPPQPRLYRDFAQFGQQPAGGIVNLKTADDDEDDAPGGEDNEPNASGPFIGVASRSRRKSVLHYYGIERHDRWVFTPVYR